MNYGTIIRQSWEMLKKHRFLLWLGVIAGLTEGTAGSSYKGSSQESFSGTNQDATKIYNSVINWISVHHWQAVLISVVFALIAILIIFVSYSAKAGLIYSANELSESNDKKINFSGAIAKGTNYFWRILGASLLLGLIVFGFILAVVFVAVAAGALTIATTWWLLVIFIPLFFAIIIGFVALIILLNLILIFALRQMVIKNQGVFESLAAAKKIIRKNISKTIISWLINSLLNTAFVIILVAAALMIGGILVLIGVGIYAAAGIIPTVVYGAISGIAFLLALLAACGFVNAYFSIYWTLVYKKIKD